MSPLPCSPVSNSTASEQSAQPSEVDSDDSLITPRPGPSDPAQRSAANLSKPSVPTFESQPDGQVRSPFTYSGSKNSSGNTSPTRERQKSVTFSSQTSLPRPEKLGSYKMSQAKNRIVDEYESSADESSGILAKQRGPVKTNGYGAVGTATDGPNEEVRGYEGGAEEPDQLRQRRPASVRSKDSLQNRGQPQPVTADATSPDVSTEHQGWFKALVEKYGSVELENKGSVARDHLALERTFLAWLRTSLSFASIGVAVTQLFRLNTSIQKQHPSSAETPVTFLDVATFSPNSRLRSVGKPLGATFLGISILILLIGFHRYFESQHYVIRGKFPASRGSILLVSLLAILLILASLIVASAMISNPTLNQEQLQAVLQHIRDLFSQCQTLHQQTMERQERVENMLRRIRQLRARREALEQEDARYDIGRRGYRTDDPKGIPHSPDSAVSPYPSVSTHLISRSPPQSQRHLPDSTPPPRRQLPEYMRNARVQRTPPEDRGTDSELSDHEPSEGQALGEMAMREPVDQPPIRLVLRRVEAERLVFSSDALRSPSITRRRGCGLGGIALGRPLAVSYRQLHTDIFLQNARARYAPERIRQEFCLERERLDDGDCIIYKARFGEACILLMGFDWVPFENAHRMEPPWLEHVGTSLPYISADRAAGLRFLDQDRMDCIVWLELEVAVREERIKEDLAEVLWNTWIDGPWSTARTQTTAPFMFENEEDEVDISSVAFVTDM